MTSDVGSKDSAPQHTIFLSICFMTDMRNKHGVKVHRLTDFVKSWCG